MPAGLEFCAIILSTTSLKMDGCNSIHTHAILDPAYEFMGAALNRTGRQILYSCSWPDYIRTIHPGNDTVDYVTTAKHCNIWRSAFAASH